MTFNIMLILDVFVRGQVSLQISWQPTWTQSSGRTQNGFARRGSGRHHKEKHVFFRALPEKGGGFTHARIFWPFFHQEKVPKIGTFLLKTNDICMFFVIIIIKITIITNVIIIKNHYYNQWYFFLSYAQNVVLTSGKKMTKLPELGGGGGGFS